MAESAVSFLLEQLSVVLRDERKLLGGLKQEVQSINDELVQMREFLRVADAKEETDHNLKEWIGQLREISFDFEDVLDEYMLRIGRHGNTDGFCGCVNKLGSLIKNWKDKHQIASDIKTIKHRLENVAKCQEKYKNMDVIMVRRGSSSTNPKAEDQYDGRGDALFLEDDEVVGIEKPKEQLLEWIWSKQSGLEVISVVGTGGLGKTTLAKKVYDVGSVKSYFDQHVWLVVSEYKEDAAKLLLVNLIMKLTEEVKEPPPQGLNDMSIDSMRNFIKEFLKGKKYIIVLDDVWKQSTWKTIKFALPRNGGHGCVIITTRKSEICDVACVETNNHVYNLETLPELEAKELFLRKAFPRDPCPSYLTEFVENILKRCEGLPLAIVVIGGLLATKKNRAEDWELFNRSLSHELEAGSLVGLGRLFSLSYNDLPYYLKYCFLYLSIFPEDCLLEKGKIVRLWIAEGFVQSEQHITLEEVAEKYLNELCSRSLIQVARKHIDGRVREFRIHDLLRDYITSKSREHNIVTAYDGGENQWPNKIRRLAIQSSGSLPVETKKFEHLRSLLLLSDGDIELGKIEKLVSRSRVLKVLELRGAPMEIIPDSVFKLYHLKHLCLRNTSVKVIPTWIKDLRNLETLDLKNTGVTELPKGILNLQKLRHLLVYKYMPGGLYKAPFSKIQSCRAPYEIGSHLRSLQKLFCVDADEVGDIKIVREVGKLTQLRRLGIAKLRSGDGRELCSSIAKLSSLRSLRIDSVEEGEELDLDYSLSSTGLPFLRLLHLCGRLEKLPQWIASLHGLATLRLRWSKLREDPLIWLQDLPNLTNLLIQHACVEGLSFRSNRFQKLKELDLMELKCMKWVIVEKGSLPSLEEWRIYDCELLMELPQGIDHLTNLLYLALNDMPNEFKRRAVEERTKLLASVGRVFFGTKADDGSWSFSALLDEVFHQRIQEIREICEANMNQVIRQMEQVIRETNNMN